MVLQYSIFNGSSIYLDRGFVYTNLIRSGRYPMDRHRPDDHLIICSGLVWLCNNLISDIGPDV